MSTLSPGRLHMKGSGCIRSVFQAVRRAGCLPSQVSELGAAGMGWNTRFPLRAFTLPACHLAKSLGNVPTSHWLQHRAWPRGMAESPSTGLLTLPSDSGDRLHRKWVANDNRQRNGLTTFSPCFAFWFSTWCHLAMSRELRLNFQ